MQQTNNCKAFSSDFTCVLNNFLHIFKCFHVFPNVFTRFHMKMRKTILELVSLSAGGSERTFITRHPSCICDKCKHPISFKERQSCLILTTWKEYLPYRFPNTSTLLLLISSESPSCKLGVCYFCSLNLSFKAFRSGKTTCDVMM